MDFALSEREKNNFKIRTLEFKIDQLQKRIDNEQVEAKIHTGKIRGSKRWSIYNKAYYSFERIPYAQPPIGELRFRAPKPVTAWKHVKDCTWYGPKPMQSHLMDPSIVEGAEDCLYLNVYTNSVKPTKPRPVMVWFYGGGFQFGEATPEYYGPDYFIKQDVILITVQYRLGALGFLSLNDPGLHTPGNAGLKDLILALKWVKRNAASFGGNPDCVTVFGESAGGAAAHFLMISEHARGLFHRAILQSGVATADWATADNTNRAYELAQAAGYKGENKEKRILKYLLSLTGEEILLAQGKCVLHEREAFAFAPTIEPYFTAHTVICKPVEELLDHAWGNTIPIILGATSNEGLLYERMATNFEQVSLSMMETCASYVPTKAAINSDSPECIEKGLKLRKVHTKEDSPPTLHDFFEIIGFSMFWHPVQKTIDARLKYARKTNTYLYRFDFTSKKLVNPYYMLRSPDAGGDSHGGHVYDGAAHTDELSYLFSSVLAKPMERQSREYCCIERMIALWTTFAETGNPNNVNRSHDMRGIKWRPLQRQEETFKCLNISDNLTFIDLPEMEKLKVWKSLYEMHRTLPKSTKPIDISVYSKSSL